MILFGDIPDDPDRVAPPEDDFDESQWLETCDKCDRPLYSGDSVWEFESGIPFGTICYCEDCIDEIRRVL